MTAEDANPYKVGPQIPYDDEDLPTEDEAHQNKNELKEAQARAQVVGIRLRAIENNAEVLNVFNEVMVEIWNDHAMRLQDSHDDIKEVKFSQGAIDACKKAINIKESLEMEMIELEKLINDLTESLA